MTLLKKYLRGGSLDDGYLEMGNCRGFDQFLSRQLGGSWRIQTMLRHVPDG